MKRFYKFDETTNIKTLETMKFQLENLVKANNEFIAKYKNDIKFYNDLLLSQNFEDLILELKAIIEKYEKENINFLEEIKEIDSLICLSNKTII